MGPLLVALVMLMTTVHAFQPLLPRRQQQQQQLRPESHKNTHHHHHHRKLWRRRRLLFGEATRLPMALDDDEEENEEDVTEEVVYAPQTERETYVSEAEQAQQANALAAASGKTVELPAELSHSFLQYALSIIMGRAIPDARDGLKPVHRRILYALHQLNLASTSSHRKCARVVGEVLGKFHPHGDVAVYDALVRLAQDFSTHYPLIDGHGNFGSIDADPAAAMRYTECRLTALAEQALLQNVDASVVDFAPNFDGNEVEPTVLPARLPVLLLNGASGIAVGMATNVPPHNLKEIVAACTALVQGRQTGRHVSDERLLQLVPGPDFPTGASILGTDGAKQLYTTSSGGIVLRAKTEWETLVSGGTTTTRNALVITELPYQVNKAALLEKMAALVNAKKLEGISDLRDESDREGMRVVIELKRDATPNLVLNHLYQKTPLQTTFSGNFLALMSNDDNSIVPQRFTLRQALDCFLDFRFGTLRRQAQREFTKVTTRAHVVEGLLLALQQVNAVIAAIRTAADAGEARTALHALLDTSDAQTEAILKLQLGQLTRLNGGKLTAEQVQLQEQAAEWQEWLTNDSAVYDALKRDLAALAKQFGTAERHTRILADADGQLSELDLIKNSKSVIVVTRSGYMKRMPLKTFDSQQRGTRGKRGAAAADDAAANSNEIAHCFTCNNHDTLLMVTQKGIAYGLPAYQVPTASRTAKGQAIPSVLPIAASDTITSILPVSEFREDEYLVLCTAQGTMKKTPLQAFETLTSRGLRLATLQPGDLLNWCHHCRDTDDILVGTVQGRASRFGAADLRPTSRTSRGVKALTLRHGDSIADMNVLSGGGNKKNGGGGTTQEEDKEYVLVMTARGFGKRIATSEFLCKKRGGLGVRALKFKKSTTQSDDSTEDCLKCLRTVREQDEILVITERGIMVRQYVANISTQSRSATGVLVQRLDEGDAISSVGVVVAETE